MKSGRSGALKPGKLGLSCKVNKYTDSETDVLPFHEKITNKYGRYGSKLMTVQICSLFP